VLGFHGCDLEVRDKIVSTEGEDLEPSSNDYDWLGNGAYFWENNCQRALKFAEFIRDHPPHNSKQVVKTPAVLGAVIDLGYCMDLLDSEFLKILRVGYEVLLHSKKLYDLPVPKNLPLVKDGDLVKRKLDCAVIQTVHQMNEEKDKQPFDSVRGVFFEGKDLYPDAGFKEKNHIQIAVRNPNCVKGYFIPRDLNEGFAKP
jgi:hypothetical protein